MSAVNSFENAILLLLYNNVDIAGIGDATGLRGSSSAGSFFLSLHTGDPGESGSNATEATYTGYVRVAVARTAGGFTVTADTVANAALVSFPACSGGGPNTITHFAIQSASTGDTILKKGALGGIGSLIVNPGITPKFQAGTLTSTAA